ncbi:unnamed protein product [Paramecium octaurelia]|uniref:Uncharacterized protein n=1 Tax=Paramecium octaurelia TaxID=43137 RepID=A0A8S1XKP2_PAROT|nr:unnamed protein product [Paramecium octaurelia]
MQYKTRKYQKKLKQYFRQNNMNANPQASDRKPSSQTQMCLLMKQLKTKK